jgi:1,4-dihydroxy-2-naphthoate octaprenyltransferase
MEPGAGATGENKSSASSAKGILVLSRIPFLSPGLASLVTGIVIALIDGYEPETGLILMSIIGLALIMLATYYFNEYYDYEGDVINRTFIKFSGGSRALPDQLVPRNVARLAGWSSVAILVVIAATYLILYLDDFPWLLLLALVGAFFGVFYSSPPFKWAYRGIGEILIGFCYGILALVSGYYLVSGVLNSDMIIVALPASFTIFGVIVANEFPDIEADRAVGKRNLIVRLGLDKGARMFAVVMLLVYPVMLLSILVGLTPLTALVALPVLLLCAKVALDTLRGGYRDSQKQLRISGMTLLSNWLSSLLFIPAAYLTAM